MSVCAVLSIPSGIEAQPAVVGTVRDSSGAVLPGVTVQVAGPTLIEKVRSAASDSAGQYAVVDLAPGTFSVTFRLAGFRTVVRDHIQLVGSRSTVVDAQLDAGPVAETVTVTREPPSVDLQGARQQAVFTANLVSTIPTGRSLANLAVLVPGMTTWSARPQIDVGGTNNLQNTFVAIHGGRVSDERIYVDEVSVRNLQSEGHATNFTPNMGSTEEVAIDYGSATAEEALGGVRANYVPRSGGNQYQGSLFFSAANSAFQDTNGTDSRRRGMALPDSLKLTYDINPTFGGPILKDKVWFFTAARMQSNQNYVGGIYENRNAGNPAAWTYDPDTNHPGLSSITQNSANLRVTWQANPRNKFSGSFEAQSRTWDEGIPTRSPEAFSRFRFPQNQLAVVSWSSPFSTRLLFEARAAYHAESWRNIGGDELFSINRSLIPVTEQGGDYPGLTYRAKDGPYTGNSAPFIRIVHGAASYVTGVHSVTAGLDALWGTNTNPNSFNDSGLQYRFNDGVPNQITEFATPYELAWRVREVGAFVQDQWRLHRLALNTGLRLDYLGTSFPEQHLVPGPLVPSRNMTLAELSWYRLKDVSPRLGVAFDLTGQAKTVLRASLGRYVVALPPAAGNPVSSLALSVTRAWDDKDRDFVPDCNVLNPVSNGECGTVSDLNFGNGGPSIDYDPAILRGWNVRPMNWEFSAGIQHELRPRITASAAFFRRVYGNFTVTDNLATDVTDYTRFSVTAPRDPRLPGGGGYTVGGLFDLNPGKRGQVENYVTASSRYGRQIEHWNGLDLAVHVRLARVTVQGGVSTGRTSTDICEIAASIPEVLGTSSGIVGGRAVSPSLDQCHIDTNFLTQTKWLGSYVIPGIDLQLAGTFQSTPGFEVQANYAAPNAVVQPSLGRPLSGSANALVRLLVPGSTYGDRVNQVDLRAAKVFRLGLHARLAVNADLFNALNAAPIIAANLNYTNAQWLQPQSVLPPRLFKVSVDLQY